MLDRPVRPLAYLLTFHTYGTWLPGDEREWNGDHQNEFGTQRPDPSSALERHNRSLMRNDAMMLSLDARTVVEDTLREVAAHRGWIVHAMNVRTNHIHVVVSAEGKPEPVMNAFKSWATRRLREAGLVGIETKVWSRHGSTRYLWDRNSLDGAIKYVRDEQDGARFGR